MKSALFIFNPFSGKELIRNKLFDIINELTVKGYKVTVYPTQEKNDGYKTICQCAKNYDLLIVSGGDGTLNEAVSALITMEEKMRPPFIYLPTGSTNDFATSIGISKKPMQALEEALKGNEFLCDLGKFQDKYFSYIAAFGAFTDVAYDTPQQIKNYLGHLAYVAEGIKRLPFIKSHKLRINHDGVVEEGKFMYGMVSNSYYVGGFKSYKNSDVNMSDGVFECMFIREPENPIEFQYILTGLLMKGFENELFYTFKAKFVKIESEEDINWTLDGEYGGVFKTVEIENLRRKIRFLK